MRHSTSSYKWAIAALAAALAILGAACAPSVSSPEAPLAPAPEQAQAVDSAEAAVEKPEAGEDAPGSPEMEPEIEFFGAVESMGADAWAIAGQTVQIDAQTQVRDAVQLSERVRVRAHVMADGSLAAREIELSGDDMPGQPGAQIEFAGEVEAMAADAWTIDGQSVAITAHTEIKGSIRVGDRVKVHARVGADGALTAREIEPAGEDEPVIPGVEVEFRGAVEAMGADAWTIGGMTFRVTAATEIEAGLEVGDFVKVHARRQAGGSLWAREIEREDDQPGAGAEVEFSGTVEAMGAGAWTIDGMTVHVTAQTEIEAGIGVGDFVEVHARVEADGSLVARQIKLDDSGSGDVDNDNDDNANDNRDDNQNDNDNRNDNDDNGNDNQNDNGNDNGDDNQNGNDNGNDDNGNDNQNDNDDDNQNDNDNGNENDDNGNDNGDNGNG